MFVEAKRETPWTKPEDIRIDATTESPVLGGYSAERFQSALCDGSVRTLAQKIDGALLRNLIQINDGNYVDLDEAFWSPQRSGQQVVSKHSVDGESTPDTIVATTLLIGWQDVARDDEAIAFVNSFKEDKMRSRYGERLLAEPRIRGLTANRMAKDPARWLSRHFYVVPFRNQVQVGACGLTKHMTKDDSDALLETLDVLVESAVQLIRNDATEAGLPVQIVSRTEPPNMRKPKSEEDSTVEESR